MMFFSAVGLISGFLFLFISFRIWPRAMSVAPMALIPRTNRLTAVLSIILVVSGFAGFGTINASWDLRRLEFQDEKTREAADWLRNSSKVRPPFFEVTFSEAQSWPRSGDPRDWAKSQGITYEGVANYLPRPEVQQANRLSWREKHCLSLVQRLSEEERNFFWPFITHACELEMQINNHRYLDHLKSDGQWISLWIPHDEKQEAAIREARPEAVSLRSIADIFPNTLMNELLWMAPLAALLAASLIFLHFRNILLTAIALIPFVCGLGLISIMHWLFGMEFSFVSLIGTVMIFGFSVDYGIFVADAGRSGQKNQSGHGTWTAITFAAITTVAGYAPLLLCKHPVLLHLGQALFFGTVGTYLGAFWGIPQFMKRIKRV
jgi:hypothetical protein